MTRVFKIALPEKGDVREVELKDTAVDSLYPSPKIDTRPNPPHSGIIFLDWVSTSYTLAPGLERVLYSFRHGYDYVPSVIASHKFDNGTQRLGGILPLVIGSLGIITIDADELNINLKYVSIDAGIPLVAVPPFTLQARFFVMAERGYTDD